MRWADVVQEEPVDPVPPMPKLHRFGLWVVAIYFAFPAATGLLFNLLVQSGMLPMPPEVMATKQSSSTKTAGSSAFKAKIKSTPTKGTSITVHPPHYKELMTPMIPRDLNAPVLGLDLDGCVDEAPAFFRTLSHFWTGRVIVITFRDDREKAKQVLFQYDIRYDELILVDTFDAKADVIIASGISVYFDDQPEMLKNVPPNVQVMLVRNGGNFDFGDRKWMLSNKTGKIL
jgi:hypothetical protein